MPDGLRTTPPAPEDAIRRGRERLRRAAEDGERCYRVRMHGEPTGGDDNRIDGILTIDLPLALGLVDSLVAAKEAADRRVRDYDKLVADYGEACEDLDEAERQVAALAEALREITDLADKRQGPGSTTAKLARAALAALSEPERNTTEEEP